MNRADRLLAFILPISIAGPMVVYYGLYGSKKSAVLAAAIVAVAVAAGAIVRSRRVLRWWLGGILAIVAAAIPFTEGHVDQYWKQIRGATTVAPAHSVQRFGVEWTTQFAAAAPSGTLGPNDWAGWRGTQSNGIAADADPPVAWSETANVVWRSDVPGRGYASPCVVGDRVILATADEVDFSQGLLCYDASDGRLLWASRLHGGTPVAIHAKNSHASATPCSDGRWVFAVFLAEQDGTRGIWASAVDLAGRVQWQKFICEYQSNEGYSASPALDQGTLYVAADGLNQASLTALDSATGAVRWTAERSIGFSFASPVVADVARRKQVLLHGNHYLSSYDPSTGRELWRCGGLPQTCGGTPVWDHSCVYVSGGYPEKVLLAVRADGSGDVSETHVVWKGTSNVPYVSSGVLFGRLLFTATDQGVMTCVNAADGKSVGRARLSNGASASPIIGGGRLYLTTEDGTTFVFKADETMKKLAENSLSAGGLATPALVADGIFLRTDSELYRVQANVDH